jgi:hypothetical protein
VVRVSNRVAVSGRHNVLLLGKSLPECQLTLLGALLPLVISSAGINDGVCRDASSVEYPDGQAV